METALKKILKSISLELRHILEGSFDAAGHGHPGDVEKRLAAIGVRRDRAPVRVDELPHLSAGDRRARQVIDAYLTLRADANVDRAEAVAEFVRETAYTWATRLLALRCLEARGLIDEVILQKAVYGGRSLEHHRLAQRQPEVCGGEDDGLLAVLDKVFVEQAQHLPMLFDPEAPGVALRPSAAAIKRCVARLSEHQKVGDQEVATGDVFTAPDAFGWAYQYWNTEAKDRVFEKVRTQKGAKIEGPDVIPATQLYTEPYIVKFLVQNSLGATWMGMHPESKLCESWEYYVRDADRAPVAKKPVSEITFLDPACGSGHFLLEAFDLYYDMYLEEGLLTEPEDICRSILEKNLLGIDIDARAVQIAEAVLWMKAAERAFGFGGKATNLVAAVASHLKGPQWQEFLDGFERDSSLARVLHQFAQAMEHIDELGSLVRPDEELRAIIHEEHATRGRQVTQPRDARFLFPPMAEDKLGGPLRLQDVSDEEYGARMLDRAWAAIHAFTERARQAGAAQAPFPGYEASAGFRLFDVLQGTYDVVAANPPYMGSRNMGPRLKRHIETHFKQGRRDLFAAFMLRNAELAAAHGRVAMVTQQSWMFLRSFADLRAASPPTETDEPHAARFDLLNLSLIETLVHLGPGAFEGIGGEVVSTVMYVFSPRLANRGDLLGRPQPDVSIHTMTCFRLVGFDGPEAKSKALRSAVLGPSERIVFRPHQNDLARIPSAPLVYWVSSHILAQLSSAETVATIGGVKQGLATGWNQRFVRFHWECPDLNRWRKYAKGGGYQKWFGLETHRVDWNHDGRRVRSLTDRSGNARSAVRNDATYFTSGITYTLMAGGALGLRLLDDAVYDVASMSMFPEHPAWDRWSLMAILNSTIASYLARLITQELKFNTSYVSRLPIPPSSNASSFVLYGQCCTELKMQRVRSSVLEESFSPAMMPESPGELSEACGVGPVAAILHTVEGRCQQHACEVFGVTESDWAAIVDETGTPAGWFPLISHYDNIPDLVVRLSAPLDRVVSLQEHSRRVLSPDELRDLKQRLRNAFEAGRVGTAIDDRDSTGSGDGTDDEVVAVGARIPIPPESLLEELSQTLEIHPISVYWLIKEGIEREGWRCLPEERRLMQDRLTVWILQLLGHRWPRQIEGHEPAVEVGVRDGIVPLTERVGEPTLAMRLRERTATDLANPGGAGLEQQVVELLGSPLGQWSATEFFRHHTRQFRRRPVVWQIQSAAFTARTKPAFACIVYYHKLDGDMLDKIRTQYLGPLRQRWETELRGLESVGAASRSDSQASRRTELGDLIEELQDFDVGLRGVQESGFETAGLRRFAMQDGILCMKARWLRRLGEIIQAGPLAGWKAEGAHAGIHSRLPEWIDEAMTHVHHHCSRVEPEAWESDECPTGVSLAARICEKPGSLVTGALRCANQRWWKQLDDEVLMPLRQELGRKKETLKGIQAELKALAPSPSPKGPGDNKVLTPGPSPGRRTELEAAERRLKQEIKALKNEFDRITGRGGQLRDRIAAWQCPEAAGWEPWLAGQPMYDAISSVDGRRRPPTTVMEWVAQERSYVPDINDGVRVNIAPLQKARLLAAEVLAKNDLDKAIADRAEWRADERRWCREGKLPHPGWWLQPDTEPSVCDRRPFAST